MDTKIQPVIPRTKRGPYRQHSVEFKRAIVARSLVEGTSVSRLAREFNINANQVFTWRKQFADVQGMVNNDGCQLLPVTLLESSDTAAERTVSASASASAPGVILLTVGRAQLRLEGGVDPATLAQVLARLLP